MTNSTVEHSEVHCHAFNAWQVFLAVIVDLCKYTVRFVPINTTICEYTEHINAIQYSLIFLHNFSLYFSQHGLFFYTLHSDPLFVGLAIRSGWVDFRLT